MRLTVDMRLYLPHPFSSEIPSPLEVFLLVLYAKKMPCVMIVPSSALPGLQPSKYDSCLHHPSTADQPPIFYSGEIGCTLPKGLQ